MSMLKLMPLFPLYYKGRTIFYPIHVTDMCEVIERVILNEVKGQVIECIGPEKITFKEIIKRLLKTLEIKRLLVPTPLFIAKIFANFQNVQLLVY